MDEPASTITTILSSGIGGGAIVKLVSLWFASSKESGRISLARDKHLVASQRDLIGAQANRIAQLELAVSSMQQMHEASIKEMRIEHVECMRGQMALTRQLGELQGEMRGRVDELRSRLAHYDTSSKVAEERSKVAETKANTAIDLTSSALQNMTPPEART